VIRLVIDKNFIKRRSEENDFFRANFSMAWLNTLEKEMGKCSVFSPAADPKEIFSSASIVIISSSVRTPQEEFLEEAGNFVSNGGLLVVEMPSSHWNSIVGRKIFPDKEELSYTRLESGMNRISPRVMYYPFQEYLGQTPILTRILEVQDIPDDMEVLMYINQHPGIIQAGVDKGWILFLMFDFQMQLTALRQGIPSDPGYKVGKRFGRIPFIIESEDLLLDGKMIDTPYPYADILEKFLFLALEDLVFLPKLWYFPFEFDGVFLMSHDDEKRGKKKASYMLKDELLRGYTSTFFVTCPPGAEERWPNADRDIIGKGFDIQWHWNRFPDNMRVFSPEEQIDNFNNISGVNLTSCRIHFLNWGDHYTEPFRVMEKMGVFLDSSYGPNKGKGYPFGTGMPFHPLDTNGKLFSLFEIPFNTQENWGGVNIDYMKELLNNSAENYHSVIIPLFHPHKIAYNTGRDLWLGSFDLAKKYNHWITTFSLFGDFYKSRCSVEINRTSEWGSPKSENENSGVFINTRNDGKKTLIKNIPTGISCNLAIRIPIEKEWDSEYRGSPESGIDNQIGDGNASSPSGEDETVRERNVPVSDSRIIKDVGRHYRLVRVKTST